MKNYHRVILLALATLVIICLVPAGFALKSFETSGQVASPAEEIEELPGDMPYRYQYSLEAVTDEEFSDKTRYALYVVGKAKSGVTRMPPALHSGSITLQLYDRRNKGEDVPIFFEPDESYMTIAYPSNDSSKKNTLLFETGRVEGGSYIGFSWYIDENKDAVIPDENGRQKIGILTFERADVKLSDIGVVAWTSTTSGKSWLESLRSATGNDAEREEILAYINATWRMPDEKCPQNGFYQGYFGEDFPEGEGPEGSEHAVDLTADWVHFSIQAYTKARAVTLLFYQKGEDDVYSTVPTAQAVLTDTDITTVDPETGRYTQTVNFSNLTFTDHEGVPLEGNRLPEGVYAMSVIKPSHVTWRAEELTVTRDSVCPELSMHTAILPCGNIGGPVNTGGYLTSYGDDRIKLEDRTQLLLYLNKGATDDIADPSNMAYYADLNGDGKVTLADLNIMMAEENYNCTSVVEIMGEGERG